MTCTRDAVRMSGTLSGCNGTAKCVVSATRVTLEGTRLNKDCMYVMEWVSLALPLGDYRMRVEGKMVDMCLSASGWRQLRQKPS